MWKQAVWTLLILQISQTASVLWGMQLSGNKVQWEICFKYYSDLFNSTEYKTGNISMHATFYWGVHMKPKIDQRQNTTPCACKYISVSKSSDDKVFCPFTSVPQVFIYNCDSFTVITSCWDSWNTQGVTQFMSGVFVPHAPKGNCSKQVDLC